MREERVALSRRERAQMANPEATPDEDRLVSPVLVLQRQAGNRAVGSLLARDASKEADQPATATVKFPQPIGVIPVNSFTMEGAQTVVISIPHSAVDAALFKAAQDGKSVGDVVISSKGMNLKITDGIIASMSADQDSSTVRIAGTVAVVEPDKEPGGKLDSDKP